MKSLPGTSNEGRSNGHSTAGISIRPRRRLPEQIYLDREAVLARQAMRNTLGELRKAANPLPLMRQHPVVAGVLIGGAAAAAVAMIARGRAQDDDTATLECAVPESDRRRHGIRSELGSAIRSGLTSLLVSKLLSASSGNEVRDSDQSVD